MKEKKRRKNASGMILPDNPKKKKSVWREENGPMFSSELMEKLEQAFIMGCSDNEACLYANICPKEFKKYLKAHKDFAEHRELLREDVKLKARFKIKAGIEDSYEFALKVMERINKKEYSLKSEIGVTTSDGEDVLKTIIENKRGLTDEQLLEEVAKRKIARKGRK